MLISATYTGHVLKFVNIAKRVEKCKSKLSQKQLLQRTKVTEFILAQRTRQEFEPILGPFIDKALAEPLHLANNNWQFVFSELFDYVLHSKTVIPGNAKNIADLPVTCCLRKFLTCLKKDVKANRLYKSILLWFREGRKGGAPFSLRFTGEETRLMRNGFCKLVKVVLDDYSSNSADLKVYALAFMAVNLRDAVSIFSRVTNMSQGLLSDLNKYCKRYFNAASLFVRVTVRVAGIRTLVVNGCTPLECFFAGLPVVTRARLLENVFVFSIL